MANPLTFLLPFRYHAMGTILVVQVGSGRARARGRRRASARSSRAARSKG